MTAFQKALLKTPPRPRPSKFAKITPIRNY